MPKYEFLVDGKVLSTQDLRSDDEAIDFCIELQIAESGKNVDWRRVYEQENRATNL